ncbi:triose-phosphate isomerase, partial [Staphylococcus saprophyticus]|uniref:triose-phosphate isomerase n=1 Tax=Staphylococcus saprophyticus TaxID=29385 RepID=UPI001785782F
ITPILSLPETHEHPQTPKPNQLLPNQLKKPLHPLSQPQLQQLLIPYQPISTIRTPKSSTPKHPNKVSPFVTQTLPQLSTQTLPHPTPIQYPPTLKPNNIKQYITQSHIHPPLLPPPSLKVHDF